MAYNDTLHRIEVNGYKGLHGTALDLKQGGLTVLLGPNGSGKSSVFGAIKLLWEASVMSLRESHIAGERYADFVEHGDSRKSIELKLDARGSATQALWRLVLGRAGSSSVKVLEETLTQDSPLHRVVSRDTHGTILLDGKPLDSSVSTNEETICGSTRPYSGVRDGTNNDVWRDPVDRVNHALGSVRIAQLNPVRLAEPVPLGEQVGIDGYGLAAQMLQLSSTRRKVFTEIQDQFCRLFPWVEEIELPTISGRATKTWATK